MIIALGFRARSGKDLVGSYLVRRYEFERLAFADTLKNAAKENQLKILTKKPVLAGEDETSLNARAKSAKLRAGEKL